MNSRQQTHHNYNQKDKTMNLALRTVAPTPVADPLMSALKERATTASYRELSDLLKQANERLVTEKATLDELRLAYERNEKERIERVSELAFTPAIEARGDAILKRLDSERERIEERMRGTRSTIERAESLVSVLRAEIQGRSRALDDKITAESYALWKQGDLDMAIAEARQAIIKAILCHCGHTTERPTWVSVDGFVASRIGHGTTARRVQDAEDKVREALKATIVRDNPKLG